MSAARRITDCDLTPAIVGDRRARPVGKSNRTNFRAMALDRLPLVRAESKTLPRGLETTTDNGGRYMLQNVPIGSYTITVTLSGFRTIKQTVDVRIASIITLNPRLTVGSLSEAVEVVGNALSIDP